MAGAPRRSQTGRPRATDPERRPGHRACWFTTSGGRRGTGRRVVCPSPASDPYGNHVGPGRGDDLSITGVPGTIVSGPVRDNGDGSYTVLVTWDASSGNRPGLIIGQPGRPPVVVPVAVNDPKTATEKAREHWKVLFWLMLLLMLLLLVLWIIK